MGEKKKKKLSSLLFPFYKLKKLHDHITQKPQVFYKQSQELLTFGPEGVNEANGRAVETGWMGPISYPLSGSVGESLGRLGLEEASPVMSSPACLIFN